MVKQNQKKKMKNKYIDYNEVLRKQRFKQDLENRGFIIIQKKPLRAVAYILIGVGIITLPLPTGSVLLIGVGLSMLGLSVQSIRENIRKKIFKFKMRFRK